MTAKIIKKRNKWVIYDEVGHKLFVGKTKLGCLEYAYENCLKISWISE